jgi:Domain of unknown function (DUF3786)
MPTIPPQSNTATHPEPIDPQRLEQRFAQRLDELRLRLANTDPASIAGKSGATYTPADRRLQLALWSRPLSIACSGWIAYPEGEEQQLPAFDQALLLYYLTTADGLPLSGEWIAFSDLPDGRFYNQAFQGYTGKELARLFQDDRAAFERAAQALGGVRQPLGDAAFAFQALPRAPLLAVFWQGDEDFPSSCQILFDAAASHYLPTDAYAILGSTLTRRLIKARR